MNTIATMTDLISREAAIAHAISGLTREFEGERWIRVSEVRDSLQEMVSSQPVAKEGHWIIVSEKEQFERGLARANASNNFLLEEISKMKHEYEQYINRISSAKQWIPIKYRNMTKDEVEIFHEMDFQFGFIGADGIVFECTMPKDGQEIWISTDNGCVYPDVCVISDNGHSLEERIDYYGVVAWMPLDKPEPYKGGE